MRSSNQKIGCGSGKKIEQALFSHLALSFDKIGCGSEAQNQINLFCSSLTLHYLCAIIHLTLTDFER